MNGRVDRPDGTGVNTAALGAGGGSLPYLVLFVGVAAVSTAAILINNAHVRGAPALTIAAGRLMIAAAILTPLALTKHQGEIRSMTRRDVLIGIMGGLLLAVHFASWILSLTFTSVASSTALVAMNPLFVGAASALLFRERPAKAVITGMILSIAGSILIGLSDRSGGHGSNPLAGDVLALIGAMAGAGYFLVGRQLRKHISIIPYIWLLYGVAAITLLLWMLLVGQSLLGFSPLVYVFLLLLAIGPQLTGHTAFNWSLRYLSATFVTVATLGEPIGSSLLALLLLPDQQIATLQLAGGAVLLLGIAIISLAEHRRGKGRDRISPTAPDVSVEVPSL